MEKGVRSIFTLGLFVLFVQFGQTQIVIVDNYNELKSDYFNVDDDTIRVINFWATWCKPCVEELPYFKALNQDLSLKKTKVYLVSLDFKSQIEKRLIPFVEKNLSNSNVVAFVDPESNSWIPQINKEWSGAIPATFMSKGNESWFREGDFESTEEIIQQINKLN